MSHPEEASSGVALNLIQALINQGNQILQIFFQGNGIYHATNLKQNHWLTLTSLITIPLIICSNSAKTKNISTSNITPNFKISGIAAFIEACINSDRVISFD